MLIETVLELDADHPLEYIQEHMYDIIIQVGVYAPDDCQIEDIWWDDKEGHLMDHKTYLIVYKDAEGAVLGYLSRNLLMAKLRKNAFTFKAGEPHSLIRGYLETANRLLIGPHPFDHAERVCAAVEEAI